MYNSKSAMTTGAVVKYLKEQHSISSINSLSDILEGLNRTLVKKVKGTYYVFIKLYSIEGHLTTMAIPFDWNLPYRPGVSEGIMAAKSRFGLEKNQNV